MSELMQIEGRQIGPGHQPFVVAELSCNHNGELGRALRLIRLAKKAGADSVKVQLYDPERLAHSRGGPDKVLTAGPWAGRRLLDLYTEGHTPREWFPAMWEYARKQGITIFASVFDEEGVEFLETLGCPAYKVSSFEVTNLPLIERAAATGKPLIISTGMADDGEIYRAALSTISDGMSDMALLHCVSDYPCQPDRANLSRIEHLSTRYSYSPVGWSDHTLGSECAIAAVALGACIIEKHLTLSRADGGLDAAFSMEPHEFARMVHAIRNVHLALQPPKGDGEGIYREIRSCPTHQLSNSLA